MQNLQYIIFMWRWKISVEFHICISVPLRTFQQNWLSQEHFEHFANTGLL